VALKNLGRFEEAVVCFDAALAINRKFADPWINKADVMVKLGRLREAIAAFKEFIRYAPRELAATVSAVKTTLRRLESQCAKE
jgi:tetratricopeptide (TPR) repeat protein